MKYLNFLKKFLDDEQAARTYLFWYRFGVLVIAGLLFVVAGILLVVFYRPERLSSDGFQQAQVLFTYSKSTEEVAFRMYATVELPDGTRTTLSTTRYALAFGTLDTICVKQLKGESGKLRHRWVARSNCQKEKGPPEGDPL